MRIQKRRSRPRIEALEDRRIPATWGIPWADPQHLTVSFVPDGTNARGQSSQLFEKLDSQLGSGNWEGPILKALQTWAVNANINVGVVADGGQALGIAGPAQGDARFGDIRVSAEPLPADVLAITAPYDPSYGSTSGDIILNSNVDFKPTDHGSYDLFTVALHEAGHVYGFADSSDPSSFMDNVYQGPRTALAPGAIPALQALYGGPRNINAIDGNAVGKGLSNPASIPTPPANGTSSSVTGDLASANEVDSFRFTAPALTSSLLGLDVQVQTAGLSLLTPRVTVYDPFGNVVGTAAARSVSEGASVHLAVASPGQTYTVRVQAATSDVFSVGSYDVTVGATLSLGHKADPRAGSEPLPVATGAGISTTLQASGAITQIEQCNTYRFKTPNVALSGLTVNLKTWGVGLEDPVVTVYDALGTVVGSETGSNAASPSITLFLPTILPNATYFVRVEEGKLNQEAAGTYLLTVSFGPRSTSGPSTNFTLATPWFGSNTPGNGQGNTTLGTAAVLQTPGGEARQSRYLAIEGLNGSQTQQYYKLTTPVSSAGRPEVMTVSVQTLGMDGLLPWIGVFDPSGKPVSARVIAEQDGIAVVQVPVASPGASYYLEVSSAQARGTQAVGNFTLNVTFGNTLANLGSIATGTLPASLAGAPPGHFSTILSISQGELFSFVLSGSDANAGSDALLRMTLVDSHGKVISTLSTSATLAASTVLTLDAGNYTILIEAVSPSGRPIPTLIYSLTGANLTDPIKVHPTSGSGGASTGR